MGVEPLIEACADLAAMFIGNVSEDDFGVAAAEPSAECNGLGEPKVKAKPKAKGKAKSKKQDGQGKKQPATSCICPGCMYPKYPGSRFCSLGSHKKAWDNLVYQRRSRKDVSEAQKQAFDQAMSDDAYAGKEVAQFLLDNPPEMRRKGLVDFARYERVVGLRVSKDDQDGSVPMTERAFLKYCDNTLGLDDQEALEYWQALYSDRAIERDHDGYKGAEQLWVPAHRMRLNSRSRYVDNRSLETSDNIKAPTADQRQMLRNHLERQCPDLRDEHFQIEMPMTPTKNNSNAALFDNPTPEKVSAKVVNLPRERAVLQRSMESTINKLGAEYKKSTELCCTAKDKYDAHPPQLKSGDRGLLTFCRLFQIRQEAGMQVQGKADQIMQLVPDAVIVSASDSAPVPATPASELQGAEIAVCDQLSQKRATVFGDWLESQRVELNKFWEGQVTDLCTLEDAHRMLEDVVSCQDPEKFLELKSRWAASEKALTGVAKAMKSSADDLLKHMKVKVQEDAREKKRTGLSF